MINVDEAFGILIDKKRASNTKLSPSYARLHPAHAAETYVITNKVSGHTLRINVNDACSIPIAQYRHR
jgi:hypothetical protein